MSADPIPNCPGGWNAPRSSGLKGGLLGWIFLMATTSSRLVRSYAADLRQWIGGIATRYTLAVVILLVGALSILVALGFGVGALFDFLEARYGTNIAFAAVGGFFLVVGIAALLAGLSSLKRRIPPLPRPDRQIEGLKRSLALPAAVGLLTNRRNVRRLGKDPVTGLLVSAAALVAIGWIVASSLSRSRAIDRDAR